jgi:DNA polymerase-3 subunit epsilon
MVRIWAEHAPFDSKELLKQRGYRWNTGERDTPKAWYIDLPEDQIEMEITKLNQDVYPHKRDHLPMKHFNAKKRYSHRI